MDKFPFLKNFTLESLMEWQGRTFNGYSVPLPGGFAFEPTYLQAILMVFLIFLLILTMGSLRHRMVHWELKGLIPGIGFGFLLALILEGILIIGGHSILTDTLGWKSAPKPISNVLDAGRDRLTNVLGETTEVKSEESVIITPDRVFSDFKSLSPTEYESVKRLICE